MRYFLKFFPALFFWGMFAIAVFKLPYPDSLTQANKYQVFLFFIPLFLAISVSVNLLLKNLLSTGFISSGLIFLLVLKALDSLNLLTAILTILATALFVSYFRNTRTRGSNRIKQNLTNSSKIPKLTKWRKHTSSS